MSLALPRCTHKHVLPTGVYSPTTRAARRRDRAADPLGWFVLWPTALSPLPLTVVMTVLVPHHNNSYSNVVDASMRLSRCDRACVGPREAAFAGTCFPIHDRF